MKKFLSILLCAALAGSCVLAGCFLTDPVQEQLQDQSSVTTEEQKNMDALVDQIASKFWDLDLDSLHPDYYRLIDAQAREELMAYGDTALDYLVNRLRNTQSNVHNIKEQVLDTIVLAQLKSMIALASNHSDEFYRNAMISLRQATK